MAAARQRFGRRIWPLACGGGNTAGNDVDIVEATPRDERWTPTLWGNGTTNQTEVARRLALRRRQYSDGRATTLTSLKRRHATRGGNQRSGETRQPTKQSGCNGMQRRNTTQATRYDKKLQCNGRQQQDMMQRQDALRRRDASRQRDTS